MFLLITYSINSLYTDSVLLQIHQVLFAAVAAVGSNRLQCISECPLMLFQNRDQRVVVRPVTAHITVDNEVILYRNLDIVCRPISIFIQKCVVLCVKGIYGVQQTGKM